MSSAGLGLIAAGMLVLAQMGEHSSYLLQLAGIVPLGVGMGLAMTPATTGITESLPASQQGVGSALNDVSRELGGALGIAVIGSALTATYRSHLHLPGAPASIVAQARSSLASAAKLGGSTAAEAHTGLHLRAASRADLRRRVRRHRRGARRGPARLAPRAR